MEPRTISTLADLNYPTRALTHSGYSRRVREHECNCVLKEAEAARAASDATVMGLSWWGRVDLGWNGADVELREVGSQTCVT